LTSLLLLLGQVAPDIARHDMIKDFHNDKISSRLEASNMDYKM